MGPSSTHVTEVPSDTRLGRTALAVAGGERVAQAVGDVPVFLSVDPTVAERVRRGRLGEPLGPTGSPHSTAPRTRWPSGLAGSVSAYTSQRCSSCGETLAANRPSQAQFCCQNCGYAIQANYNAAKNIGMKLLRAEQTSPPGGATSHLALTSGTVTVNGGFSPADS